jgi:quercetin dioxygenase-like cupin family protein
MEIFDINKMVGGWFIGNFEPSAYQTDKFEVCYKKHLAGEKWDVHYHKIATEINYLIKGKMTIQDRELKSGDIFILEPNEIADPIFLEDCELVIVKTPSVKNDKYIVGEPSQFNI